MFKFEYQVGYQDSDETWWEVGPHSWDIHNLQEAEEYGKAIVKWFNDTVEFRHSTERLRKYISVRERI